MDQLEEALKNIKTEIKEAAASNDDDALVLARIKAKELKKEKKALKKKMESAEDNNEIDQAKLDEIKAKIADAKARQDQAFDDDDDEAEEAAIAEIQALGKELASLTGGTSIPKKKLQDAQKKDSIHNS